MIRSLIPDIDYSFKDVYYGVVYPVYTKSGWLPGSRDGKFYNNAVPDSSKKSIVYWEDYGSRVIGRSSKQVRMSQRVKLVVWMNDSRISKPYQERVHEIMQAVPRRQGNTFFKLVGQLNKDIDIFQRYSYSEAQQYITYPYDVFALEYDVIYFEPCGTV